MVVYKHGPKEFTDKLLERGQIHMKQSSGYVDGQKSIADANEGLERVVFNGRYDLSQGGLAIETLPGIEVDLHSCSVQRQETGLIYCLAESEDPTVAPNYDGCIRIADAEVFFERVTVALVAHCSSQPLFLGWGPVDYVDRSLTYEQYLASRAKHGSRVNAAFFRKDDKPEFVAQREIRGVWLGAAEPSVTIDVPGIIPLLSLVR